MRFFFELLFGFIILLTIYRRLIEPFFEGLKGQKKPFNNSEAQQKEKFHFTSTQQKKKPIDPKEIQDAEFEEIK